MEAVSSLQQQLKAKTTEQEKLQAKMAQLNVEIADLNAKLQTAITEAVQATVAPTPANVPATAPKAKPTPKPSPAQAEPTSETLLGTSGSLNKTFTTIEEQEETGEPESRYQPPDRAEQLAQYNTLKAEEEEGFLIFNWPAVVRTRNGDYQNSPISELSEAELMECLQKALEEFCKAQPVPSGHIPYSAPKIKQIRNYRPWPKTNANAVARVVFSTFDEAERLLDCYSALSKQFLTMVLQGGRKERIYIRSENASARASVSDTDSVAASDTSELSTAAGGKTKKDLVLATGVELELWRSNTQKWFALQSVQKSVSAVAKVLGVQEPVASFDVPQPAPEGAICLNFKSYEEAKDFMQKESQHPIGVKSGAVRLTLKWARRKPPPAPQAKRW